MVAPHPEDASPHPPSIVDLRQLLAARFPEARSTPQPHIPTGLPTLDEAGAAGGLLPGAITEISSPQLSAGTATVIHRLLQGAQRNRSFLALVDGRDSFDPESAEAGSAGCLRHLLWVRCSRTLEAVKAADLLLRDGNFPIVVLDLVLNAAAELRQIPSTSWYRLQRLVEPRPTALLVLTRRSMISSAQLKLVLTSRWRLRDRARAEAGAGLQFQVQRRQGGRRELGG